MITSLISYLVSQRPGVPPLGKMKLTALGFQKQWELLQDLQEETKERWCLPV